MGRGKSGQGLPSIVFTKSILCYVYAMPAVSVWRMAVGDDSIHLEVEADRAIYIFHKLTGIWWH